MEFPQNEFDALVNQVYRPVFLQKLARDWNFVPRDEAQVQQLMEDAGILRRLNEAERAKQAASSASVIDRASQHLKQAAARQGLVQANAGRDRLIEKAAADAVASNAALAEAALKFNEYASKAR